MSAVHALHVDLGALARGERPRTWTPSEDGPWATLAGWGGTALGIAWLHAHARGAAAGPEPLVIAVGAAVRAGLPTAARAGVLARAPLSGLYAEGHVGGELGARLASVAGALALSGRCAGAGNVLVVEEDGVCALQARPALAGAAPADAARALAEELGPCAVLAIGPAGERGLPFASLAAGHAPPSFVGRGGLGARFGALGLKALCVRAAPARVPEADSRALVARLRSSARLRARAEGGTLELFDAWAARGEIPLGHALADEARARADARHGCRGCPTPCGWVFERSDGAKQGARFGASHALGVVLGLESLDDALFLLGRCDRIGADAKEVGAVLALRCLAEERGLLPGPSARGRRDELARRIDELVHDERAPGRRGAAALARELGLAAEVPVSRGQAVRPEANRAALLGQCVAAGGADPMRSFPFLLESAGLERLRALLDPLPVPEAALDPAAGTAKGRLVYWHENLVSAVDMTGFCAFSAAGLLADELCDADELARWILPPALQEPADERWRALAPGARMLAAGANLVLARRMLNQVYAERSGEPVSEHAPDRPGFARAALDEPGMLDEYLALRGLDGNGTPGADARARLGTPAVLALGQAALTDGAALSAAAPSAARGPAPRPRGTGRVTLRASGALAHLLGERRELVRALPASLEQVLRDVAAADEAAGAGLFSGTRLVPAVWRAGRRLAPEDAVRAGDELELVTAIGGG